MVLGVVVDVTLQAAFWVLKKTGRGLRRLYRGDPAPSPPPPASPPAFPLPTESAQGRLEEIVAEQKQQLERREAALFFATSPYANAECRDAVDLAPVKN